MVEKRCFEGTLAHEDESHAQDTYVVLSESPPRIAYWQEWVRGLHGRRIRITVEEVGNARRRVYLESPFRADTPEGCERNLEYLWRSMRDSMDRTEAPFASHALYTQFLDEDVPAEREIGIACGLAWAVQAEATVVYRDLGITEGMRRGIDAAQASGRPVEYRTIGERA